MKNVITSSFFAGGCACGCMGFFVCSFSTLEGSSP